MRKKWIKIENLVIGVVYRYYTADGKSYVGCTINERKRRYAWNWKNNTYGGVKIASARKELGLSAFTYERLCVVPGGSKEEVLKKIEEKETSYIKLFDSFNNGYNTNEGGRGQKGVSVPKERRAKIKEHSHKKAVRLVPDDGSADHIVESMMEASRELNVSVSQIHYYMNKATMKSIKGYKLQIAA